MAKDDEPVEDLHSVAWAPIADVTAPIAEVSAPIAEISASIPETSAPIADVPTETPVPRLDYGDAAQRAEMDETKDVPIDEPVELVDAPIQIREPFSRSEKRRNQRRMPT